MEYDSPDYRAAGAAYWREEAERDREEEAKRENAERLTIQLEKHLEQNEWDAQVPHPQCQKQLIEIRELLAEWIDESLENTPVVAVALIEAAAGDINPVKEMLYGFTTWYIKELIA